MTNVVVAYYKNKYDRHNVYGHARFEFLLPTVLDEALHKAGTTSELKLAVEMRYKFRQDVIKLWNEVFPDLLAQLDADFNSWDKKTYIKIVKV